MGSTATIKLHDGRDIGVSSIGNDRGFPIFHFHGLASSRLEVKLMESAAAAAGATTTVSADAPPCLPAREQAGSKPKKR